MKKITVLYSPKLDPKHEKKAEKIRAQLGDRYEITWVKVHTEQDESDFFESAKPESVSLILSLDFAGFHAMTTGNQPVINRLPMNVVVCVDRPLAWFDSIMQQNMSYTISFLFFSKTDYLQAKSQYPHLWQMDYCEDRESGLMAYLTNLVWRF